jgi:hypothetical protein
VYNALASFMPASGVKPLTYARQIFMLCYVFFMISVAMIPTSYTVYEYERNEGITATFWLFMGLGVVVLIGNYFVMSRHLLQLLRSHLTNMKLTDNMLAVANNNQRNSMYGSGSGSAPPSSSNVSATLPPPPMSSSNVGGTTTGTGAAAPAVGAPLPLNGAGAQARARTNELQQAINRLRIIVQLLKVAGAGCGPVYLTMAFWPWY